jgi:hypothetical protein
MALESVKNNKENQRLNPICYWAGLLTRGSLGLPSPWLDPIHASTPTAETHTSVTKDRGAEPPNSDELKLISDGFSSEGKCTEVPPLTSRIY